RAADDRETEEGLRPRRPAVPVARAAITQLLLEHRLVATAGQRAARRAIGAEIDHGAALADGKAELGTAEAIVAAIDRGADGPALELEKGGMGALGRPAGIPAPGHGAHAAHQPAADQADEIELMGTLAQHDAAAEPRLELLRDSRPVDPVRVVPIVQHLQRAQRPAAHESPHLADRRLVAEGMADHEDAAGLVRRCDHRRRLLEPDRHGLLGYDMLAGG